MAVLEWDERRLGRLRAMQIILAALVMGCCMFAVIAIVVFMQSQKAADDQAAGLLLLIAAAISVADIIALLFVPKIIDAKQCVEIGNRFRQTAAEGQVSASEAEDILVFALLTVRQTTLIMQAALLEGPAFLWLIVAILTHSPVAMAAALAFVCALASKFPTKKSVGAWLADRAQAILSQ